MSSWKFILRIRHNQSIIWHNQKHNLSIIKTIIWLAEEHNPPRLKSYRSMCRWSFPSAATTAIIIHSSNMQAMDDVEVSGMEVKLHKSKVIVGEYVHRFTKLPTCSRMSQKSAFCAVLGENTQPTLHCSLVGPFRNVANTTLLCSVLRWV